MLANLNNHISKFQNIKYVTGKLEREIVAQHLATDGYCLYRGTNLHNELFTNQDYVKQCLLGDDHEAKIMNYSIGTDARDGQANSSILSVSKISNSHWVPYHNELMYTNEFPKLIAFICMKAPQVGGHTPFTNTIEAYNQMPLSMRTKFNNRGITYIRNLRDREAEEQIEENPLDLGGQKFMQCIFGTNDKAQIENLCDLHGYEYKWNLCAINKTPVLRVQYVAPAVVEYEFNGKRVRSFANSVTGMNGRYFRNYHEQYESMEFVDRPFHSLWGNGEEFKEEEHQIIEDLFYKNSIRFAWEDGDIFIADNLCWAHGRYPYEGERNIMVIMGDPYSRSPYNIGPKIPNV